MKKRYPLEVIYEDLEGIGDDEVFKQIAWAIAQEFPDAIVGTKHAVPLGEQEELHADHIRVWDLGPKH